MKRKFLVILATLAMMAIFATMAVAAPRRTLYGPEPLWDSGWVITEEGLQEFTHDLDAWPTHVEVYIADDDEGKSPVKMFPVVFDNRTPDKFYGGSVRDVWPTKLWIYWQPDGIAYSSTESKWYQAGTDYVRILIFSADHTFGPIRP